MSYRPLRIGPIEVATPVVLAPMAGVTNAPFRNLCRRFGGGLYVSEMISARALCEGSAKTDKLASFAADEPIRFVRSLTDARTDTLLERVEAALRGRAIAPVAPTCGPSGDGWVMPLPGEWIGFDAPDDAVLISER